MVAVPYWVLVWAVALVYVPRLVVAMEMVRQHGRYDNDLPRAAQAKLVGLGARATGAHQNGFEALIQLAPALLACALRGVAPGRIALAAVVWAVARTAYVGLYLADLSTLRSVAWTVAFLASTALFLLAAVG